MDNLASPDRLFVCQNCDVLFVLQAGRTIKESALRTKQMDRPQGTTQTTEGTIQ